MEKTAFSYSIQSIYKKSGLYQVAQWQQWLPYLPLLILLITFHLQAKDNTPTPDSLTNDHEGFRMLQSARAFREMQEQMEHMPNSMKKNAAQLVADFALAYDSLTPHQQELLAKEEIFGAKILSRMTNPKRYQVVLAAFYEQIRYIRQQTADSKYEYIFLVNAAPHWHGGQRAYLLNTRNGIMLEILVSTGWKGNGFGMDSEKTPLGFFMANNEQNVVGWENKTVLGKPSDLFRKLQFQQWWGMPKWLHRVDTQLEKAYITSNQFALKGQNDGSEEIPLKAQQYYPQWGIDGYLDNTNTAMRHIYIHATNRNDQLGMALSGGCVRVPNTLSYLLGYLYQAQGSEMPVFIDAIKFYEGREPQMPESPEDDYIEIERYNPLVDKLIAMSEPYRSLSAYQVQSDSALVAMRQEIEQTVIAPLVAKLLDNNDQKYTLRMTSSVPMPESAMIDWLKYHNDLTGYETACYRHHFDLRGIAARSEQMNDPLIRANCSSQTARQLIENRLDYLESYILEQVAAQLQAKGKVVAGIDTRIIFQKEIGKVKGSNGQVADIGFGLHTATYRVLSYLVYLDSLAQSPNGDSVFATRDDLKWIGSYLAQPQQVFSRQAGGKLYRDTVTYEKALLAQAYLYTLGEYEVRRDYLSQGVIHHINDSLAPHFANEAAMMAQFDKAGQLIVLRHTNSPNTRLPYRFKVGEVKQNSQRILGITLVSEEIFSKRKFKANLLTIEEIPTETIVTASR